MELNLPGESKNIYKIVGVGDFGCKVLDYLLQERMQDIGIVAINTDAHALIEYSAYERILIGDKVTHGQGTRGNSELGRIAAEDANEELKVFLASSKLVFIVAGLGGGTGSGAAPVVASVAKEMGALTVAIITLPFSFEGKTREKIAEIGLSRLEKYADTVIAVPGDNLISNVKNNVALNDTFNLYADTLYQCIRGILELLTVPGLINLDFVDIRSLITQGRQASMAFGTASQNNRAEAAVNNAIKDILGAVKLEQADGILFNIAGSPNLSLFEVNQVALTIREHSHPDVSMVFGAIIDPAREDLCVSFIAVGSKSESNVSDDKEASISKLMAVSSERKGNEYKRVLKTFLCHSSNDKPVVRKLYQRLYSRNGIDPWLDEAKLLPGEQWDHEISLAVKESDVVIVCISRNSVSKEGYVQKEIKRALDIADEKPEGTIYIIPLKLDDCDIPDRLGKWHWVNYYDDGAFDRLMQSLHKRAQALGIEIE